MRLRALFFAAIFILGAVTFAQNPEPGAPDILSVVPGAATFKHVTSPIDCYRLFGADGNPAGVAVVTSNIAPAFSGYRDEISVLVGLDESGTITGAKLLSHQEDQLHIDSIISKGFLNRFIGKKPAKNWDDLETITGATISSGAMKEDIRTASLAAVEKVLKSGVLTQRLKKKFQLIDYRTIIISLLIALSVIAVLKPGRRILRSSTLLLSFVITGLLFNTPVTIGNFIDAGRGLATGNIALLVLLGFAIISAPVKGPLYCSYLCPFGAMQDGLSAARLPKCKIDEKWLRYAAYMRWAVLLSVIVAVTGFGINAFRYVEPFSRCFAMDAGTAVWIQTGTVLIVSLFLRRPWCRMFCPTGLVIEVLSMIGTKVRCKFKCK